MWNQAWALQSKYTPSNFCNIAKRRKYRSSNSLVNDPSTMPLLINDLRFQATTPIYIA